MNKNGWIIVAVVLAFLSSGITWATDLAGQKIVGFQAPEGTYQAELLGVSQSHGVAFVNFKVMNSEKQTAILNLKTGAVTPLEKPISSVMISPDEKYALGCVGRGDWWIRDLAAGTTRKTQLIDRWDQDSFWWCDKVVSLRMSAKGQLLPISIKQVKDEKPVAFAPIYGFALAGSPDGKELSILTASKDGTKKISGRELDRSKDMHLTRVDASGKVLDQRPITKAARPAGRIVYSGNSQSRLEALWSDSTMETMKKNYKRLGADARKVRIETPAIIYSVSINKRIGTIPSLATSSIEGFDGDRVVQGLREFSNGKRGMTLCVGVSKKKNVEKLAGLPTLNSRSYCVQNTSDGLTIYYVTPDSSEIRKLLVATAKTEPLPPVDKETKPGNTKN